MGIERYDETKNNMKTHAQHSIKHCLDMIAPFEATNQELEDGQLQFYALYFYNLGTRTTGFG